MEDSHTHILSLPDDPGTAFFGVYDGHGGEISEPYLSVYFMVYSMEKYFIYKSTIYFFICFFNYFPDASTPSSPRVLFAFLVNITVCSS
jgi:hypothetical protein